MKSLFRIPRILWFDNGAQKNTAVYDRQDIRRTCLVETKEHHTSGKMQSVSSNREKLFQFRRHVCSHLNFFINKEKI